MTAQSHPLEMLMNWFSSLRARLPDGVGLSESEQVWQLHQSNAETQQQLLAMTSPVVALQGEERARLDALVGAIRMNTLVQAHHGTDEQAIARVTAEMLDTVADQRSRQSLEHSPLVDQGLMSEGLTKPLWDAVKTIFIHLDEQRHTTMRDDLAAAARTVPGMELRITEEVLGPDGTLSVVRDEMAIGPPAESEGQEFRPTMDDDRKRLLGLDDVRTAQTAGERIRHTRAERALATLKLPVSATAGQVEPAIIDRIEHHLEWDGHHAEMLPELPETLQGLRPGHIYALRQQLIIALMTTHDELRDRARRGDRNAEGAAVQFLQTAFAMTEASVFYLPVAHVPDGGPAPAHDAARGTQEVLVFHDKPFEVGPDVSVIAWLLPVSDTGQPEQLGQIVAARTGGKTTLEVSNVNLVSGHGATVAGRVWDALGAEGWSQAKRRKLPGRPGEREWKRALGRGSQAEMSSGSLAQVWTRTV